MDTGPTPPKTFEDPPAVSYVRPAVTLHKFEWDCGFAVLAFVCSCGRPFNARIFRDGKFVFHTNKGAEPQPPNVEVQELPDKHLVIKCTCPLCNTGCRLNFSDDPSARFEIIG